jgi:hypothetical protein
MYKKISPTKKKSNQAKIEQTNEKQTMIRQKQLRSFQQV